MNRRLLAGMATWGILVAANLAQADIPRLERAASAHDHETRQPLDADVFFEQLVERYRKLSRYEDTTEFKQVTEMSGEAPAVMQRRVECEIVDGDLSVQTPARQIARSLGIAPPVRSGTVIQSLRRRLDLWLAPHMALRFVDEPLEDFREGLPEGFRPTDVESVTIGEKEMVHLELKSPGVSGDCDATFDLFVNVESMLIERIQGEQRLPEGGSCQTTVIITPTLAIDESSDATPIDGVPTVPLLVPDDDDRTQRDVR